MSWYMRPVSEVSKETISDMRRMGRKHSEWLYRGSDNFWEFNCGCQLTESENAGCLVHLCDYHEGFSRAFEMFKLQGQKTED